MAVRHATAPCGAKRVFTKGRGWNMLRSRWIMTCGKGGGQRPRLACNVLLGLCAQGEGQLHTGGPGVLGQRCGSPRGGAAGRTTGGLPLAASPPCPHLLALGWRGVEAVVGQVAGEDT